MLSFDLDHARARDAVHLPFHTAEIEKQLGERNIESFQVHSAAADRTIYLQRPDLGRQLDANSRQLLEKYAASEKREFDIAVIAADGLSTTAIHNNAVPFLDEFLHLASNNSWTCSPVAIASQSRVALADEIGEILKARLCIILIGERPGLSAADSMGIYLTYGPRRGRADAERNCISNVRHGGLALDEAARQLTQLIGKAFELKLSGVQLKLI
jgi:ethanolamine ammonia-lyase small subunit